MTRARRIPRLEPATLEHLARLLGEEMSGSEMTRLLRHARLTDPLGEGHTKWKRLYAAFEERQDRDGQGAGVLAFLEVTLSPKRYSGRSERFEPLRSTVNESLALEGLWLGDDGRLREVTRARNLGEAEARADRLRAALRERRVHSDVLRFCRAELVKQNFFHAVLEAAKSVSQKIRDRTGLTEDGAELVDRAFSLKADMPLLAFNALTTPSERSAHSGYAHFVRGVVAAFRNPTAHDPKVAFALGEEDALDMLATISMVHRRLDDAVVTPAAPAWQRTA